jgi:hypothetical protein
MSKLETDRDDCGKMRCWNHGIMGEKLRIFVPQPDIPVLHSSMLFLHI